MLQTIDTDSIKARFSCVDILAGRVELRKATRAQRDALDFVQSWLDEKCVMGPGLWVSNELLYQSYGAWCKDNGVTPKGQKTLAQSLQAKGLTTGAQKKVSGVNHRGVEGLDLAIRQAV